MKQIAKHGADGFYLGKVAEQLVDGVRAAGGNGSIDDLAKCRVFERKPLKFRWRDNDAVSASPPSSSGGVLAAILNVLEGYGLDRLSSVDRMHLLVEAMRRACRNHSYILGDLDFVPMPIARLTSKEYAAGLRASIRLEEATPSASLPEGAAVLGGTDAMHFSVIDADGNMVAATMAVSLSMGSGLVVPKTGVVLNKEMDDFALKARVANASGLIGTDAHAPMPGKRMLSTMRPTLAFGQDRIAVLGTPGGSWIATMVLIGLLELFEGKPPIEIVARERTHHQNLPDVLSAEADALTREEIKVLQDRSRTTKDGERPWGNMHAAVWDLRTSELRSGADPRGAVGKADARATKRTHAAATRSRCRQLTPV